MVFGLSPAGGGGGGGGGEARRTRKEAVVLCELIGFCDSVNRLCYGESCIDRWSYVRISATVISLVPLPVFVDMPLVQRYVSATVVSVFPLPVLVDIMPFLYWSTV